VKVTTLAETVEHQIAGNNMVVKAARAAVFLISVSPTCRWPRGLMQLFPPADAARYTTRALAATISGAVP